ncbi:hypothetical protein [uncultured Flavobacterium sp.]|uniref:hypothetical protein n=1 Tax=uncultured Flavobacterium sp. TaxID=165435 RepID=UPI001222DC90|nr:hypothetical protein [uncultured Flavobacterium sp.]THD32147.1 MAG: hypothetical protein DI588_08590 [Flavobacterium johnsoniae]
MITLEEIKEYFGEECKTFPEVTEVNDRLSEKTKYILYEIGLPSYSGYGGDYIMLDRLQVINNRYLKYGTRRGDLAHYSECIDMFTSEIVFNLNYEGDNDEYHVLNTDLESSLKYVYVYVRFRAEIKIPQKFGEYYKNHSQYAKELKRQLLQINDDVKNETWANLIEEMDLGVI